jgi:Helix-turn-helix domain
MRVAKVFLPIDFVRKSWLSREARVLYALLLSYADYKPVDGWYVGIRAGQRRLRRELRCGVKVNQAMDELERAGYLQRERRRSNHYRVRQLTRDKFIQVPREFLRCRDIRLPLKLLYMVINTFDVWGSTGQGAYPKQAQLAQFMGCAKSTISDWVDDLAQLQLVHIEDDGRYVLYEFVARSWAGDGTLESWDPGLPEFANGHTGGVKFADRHAPECGSSGIDTPSSPIDTLDSRMDTLEFADRHEPRIIYLESNTKNQDPDGRSLKNAIVPDGSKDKTEESQTSTTVQHMRVDCRVTELPSWTPVLAPTTGIQILQRLWYRCTGRRPVTRELENPESAATFEENPLNAIAMLRAYLQRTQHPVESIAREIIVNEAA